MPIKVLWILGAFLITALVIWYMRRNDNNSTPQEDTSGSDSVLDFSTALDLFLKLCNEPEPPVAAVITYVDANGRHRQVFAWIKPGCGPLDVDTRTREILNSTFFIEAFDENKPSHLQAAVPAYHKFGQEYANWYAVNGGSVRHGSVFNLQAIDPSLVQRHAFFTAVFKNYPKITMEVRAAVGRGNVTGSRGGTEHTLAVIGASLDARPHRAFMPNTETVEQMPAVKTPTPPAAPQFNGSMLTDVREVSQTVGVNARPPVKRR